MLFLLFHQRLQKPIYEQCIPIHKQMTRIELKQINWFFLVTLKQTVQPVYSLIEK